MVDQEAQKLSGFFFELLQGFPLALVFLNFFLTIYSIKRKKIGGEVPPLIAQKKATKT